MRSIDWNWPRCVGPMVRQYCGGVLQWGAAWSSQWPQVRSSPVQPPTLATTSQGSTIRGRALASPRLASPLDTSATTVKLCISTKHPPSLAPPDTGSGQVGAAYWRAVSAARARARPPPDPVSAISIYLCVFTPGNIHRVYLGYCTGLHSLAASQHHQNQQCWKYIFRIICKFNKLLI